MVTAQIVPYYSHTKAEALLYDTPDPIGAILFLHGFGERQSEAIKKGRGVKMIEDHPIPKWFKDGKEVPYLVFAPQCPADMWTNVALVAALSKFEEICKDRGIQEKHCTGLSMGGRGTQAMVPLAYQLNGNKPGYFQTYGVMCGPRIDIAPEDAHMYAGTKWKIWHGTADPTVKFYQGEMLRDNLKRLNIPVEFVAYEGVTHNCWTRGYDLVDPNSYFAWLADSRQPSKNYEDMYKVTKAELDRVTALNEALTEKLNQTANQLETVLSVIRNG